MQAIETERLGRIYKARGKDRQSQKDRVALSDVTLSVPCGELFGLLGPNGAGKTTLIKILTTLLAPSSGRAMVAGFDVHRWPQHVRPCINMVSGGESSGYGLLTVRENLWMFSQFYGLSSADANRRIVELLEIVEDDRSHEHEVIAPVDRPAAEDEHRERLSHRPEGAVSRRADARPRRAARREMRARTSGAGSTTTRRGRVLLTTHYMVEADELCDRVAIINAGRVLACDTPANLKRRLQGEPIFHVETTAIGDEDASQLCSLPGVRKATHRADGWRIVGRADRARGARARPGDQLFRSAGNWTAEADEARADARRRLRCARRTQHR